MSPVKRTTLTARLIDAICIVIATWNLFGVWAALLSFGLYGAACRFMPPIEERER